MGLEGFSGQRVDPLPPPVAVPRSRARRLRADRARRVGARRPRAPALQTYGRRAGGGDPITRPAAADVEQRRRDLARAADRGDGLLLPQRRGRRGDLRPRGHRARSRRSSATCRTGRATTSSSRAARPTASRPRAPQRHLVFESPGPDRDPAALPQRVRPADGARAVLPPRHPPADRAAHAPRPRRPRRQGARRATGTRPTSSTTTRSTSSAGTATSTRGRSRSTTSSRSPAASTCRRRRTRPSPGRTSSSARSARASSTSTREAIPIPYHHSNLNSEEMIYYVDGNFSSRKGIEVGSVTLHPSGIPHGPQPGLAEKSIGMTETHELAVMCDTFHPLRLTTLARGSRRRQLRVLVVRGARLRDVRRGSGRRDVALLAPGMRIRAAVLEEFGQPLAVQEVELAEPKAGEALVRLAACGVCHTDLYTASGADPTRLRAVRARARGRGRRRGGRAGRRGSSRRATTSSRCSRPSAASASTAGARARTAASRSATSRGRLPAGRHDASLAATASRSATSWAPRRSPSTPCCRRSRSRSSTRKRRSRAARRSPAASRPGSARRCTPRRSSQARRSSSSAAGWSGSAR